MGPKQKWVPKWDPKWAPGYGTSPTWTWDRPNLAWDMPNLAWDMPNLDMGHAQPGHGTCPTWTWDMPNLAWDMPNLAWDGPNLDIGHAQPGMGHAQPPWSMDMPNQWARTAQGPNNGPERPRVQQWDQLFQSRRSVWV